MRKCRERISLFPHSLSIFSQPGCQAATSCATLQVLQVMKVCTSKTSAFESAFELFSMYNSKIALSYFLFLRITVMFVESEVRNGESHLKYKMVKKINPFK